MFCSNSPDLILSNVCSIANPTEKCRNTVGLWCGGWQKLKRQPGNAANNIADLFTDFLQNFTSSIFSKYPTKSSKIQNPAHQTTYRTPYRQSPLKSSILATLQPKNQTLISPKIHPQFQNYPYL